MNITAILYAVGVFLAVILLLVIILLVAKKYLVPSGDVKVVINGDKEYHVPAGGTLLALWARQVYTCHLLVVVKVRAVNVSAKCSKVVARSSLPRLFTSPASNKKSTGVLVAK